MAEERRQTNREYLSMIADRISSERPSKEIILNTLISLEERGYGRGYRARITDSAKFKEGQDKRRLISWHGVKDHLDDLCSKQVPVNTNETE